MGTKYHGGCNGCSRLIFDNQSKCSGCQYYDADWTKPNLFTTKFIKPETFLEKIIRKLSITFY